MIANSSTCRLIVGSDDAGVFSYQSDRQYSGSVAEVRVWNVTRTSIQISQYYRKQLIGNEDTDFVELERRMRVLIPEDEPLNNHLYVDPNLLEFLYSIRGFKLTDKKNFDEMIIRINRFLTIYEKVTDAKKVTNHNLEDLHILKTQILNCFHSILYKLVNNKEMDRHNEIRFVLEEKMNELYDDCVEYRSGFVTFNDYGYNPMFNRHYDIY